MMKKIINSLLFLFIVSCSSVNDIYNDQSINGFETRYTKSGTEVTYTKLKDEVFQMCLYCHASRFPNQTVYNQVIKVVVPGEPQKSKLFDMVHSGKMPKGGRLAPEQKQMIYNWIRSGAKNN